jgi:hypothetical protein
MSPRTLLRFLAVGTVSAITATALAAQPVSAEEEAPSFFAGSAAAAYVQLLDGTVVSGPLVSVGLQTAEVPKSSSNDQVDAGVTGLLNAKALSTKVATSAVDGGSKIVSTAKAAGVELLGGAIKLDAVTTTSTVTLKDGIASFDGSSELLGLIVNHKKIPVNVGKNTSIKIPGLASITLNQTEGANTSDAGAKVNSAAIKITLLKEKNGYEKGTTILLTPTQAGIAPNVPKEGPVLGGTAYALKASITLDDAVHVLAGPFAAQYVNGGGTAGKEIEQATVKAKLDRLLRANIVGTTVKGTRKPEHSEVTVTSRATSVNLLAGAITADAVKSTAFAGRDADAAQPTRSGKTEILNLKIGGKPITIEPEPNTEIDVLGLGKVILNQQFPTANGFVVRGLVVVLSTKKLGLPAGATVELATSFASAMRQK